MILDERRIARERAERLMPNMDTEEARYEWVTLYVKGWCEAHEGRTELDDPYAIGWSDAFMTRHLSRTNVTRSS